LNQAIFVLALGLVSALLATDFL